MHHHKERRMLGNALKELHADPKISRTPRWGVPTQEIPKVAAAICPAHNVLSVTCTAKLAFVKDLFIHRLWSQRFSFMILSALCV